MSKMTLVIRPAGVDGGKKLFVDFNDGKPPEFQGYWRPDQENLYCATFRVTQRPLSQFDGIRQEDRQ